MQEIAVYHRIIVPVAGFSTANTRYKHVEKSENIHLTTALVAPGSDMTRRPFSQLEPVFPNRKTSKESEKKVKESKKQEECLQVIQSRRLTETTGVRNSDKESQK